MKISMKTKAAIIIFWLIFYIGIQSFPVVMVYADGSLDAQEVWIEFKSGWEGQGIDVGGEENISSSQYSWTKGSKFNYSSWDFDILNISDVRAYMYNGDDDLEDRTYRIGFWNYTSDNDAGKRFGYIEFTDDDTIGFEWKGATGQGPIAVTYNIFFLGVWAEIETNGVQIAYSTSDGPKKSVYASGFAGDPFSESGSYSDRTYNIQFRGWAYKDMLTTYNQYFGDSENYTARRDVNYTFPSGVTNKKIMITIPSDENLLNITRSNGGLWDEKLSESDYSIEDYNVTHNLITIKNTPIILYGGDYRIYFSSHPYCYTFNGLFIENGTKYGNVNITVYQPSGTNEYKIDGKKIIGFDEKPIQIVWEISGGGIRKFYTDENSEEFYIFTPDDTYSTYGFTIQDYSASVGSGDTFLEALRVINGTERLIERVLVQDSINAIPLMLVQNKIYIIQVRLYDNTIYRFGYFIPESDPTPTLSIAGIAMSDQAHYVGEHLALDAIRPNSTHIQINYIDQLSMTLEFFYEICYMNKTSIVDDIIVGNTLQVNWYNAVNTTDYLVNIKILHYFYDIVTYSKALPGIKQDTNEPPDWDIFGEGAKNAFSLFVIFGAVFLFSKATALIGVFFGIAMTYLLINLNMTTIPYSVAHACMALTIMWGLWGGNQ